MSNRNFSYIFSPSLLWGNVSSQSVTGLCNLEAICHSTFVLHNYILKHHIFEVFFGNNINNISSCITCLMKMPNIEKFLRLFPSLLGFQDSTRFKWWVIPDRPGELASFYTCIVLMLSCFCRYCSQTSNIKGATS